MYNLFKFVLAISSLSLFWVIYFVKSREYILLSMLIPLISILIVLQLMKFLSKDDIKKGYIVEIKNVSNQFLPNYLGYFFIALSINNGDYLTMIIISGMILIFLFVSQHNYFNPLFLILGYNFYDIKTKNGKSLLLISKSEKLSEKGEEKITTYRINDFTFIEI